MLEKEFIPYEQALALKELGFDEPCFAFYFAGGIRFKQYKDSQNKNSAFYNDTVCSVPTYSQAFRWFREKYDLRSWIESFNKTNYKAVILNHYGSTFNSNEEAELECLIKLIEITKVQEINRR